MTIDGNIIRTKHRGVYYYYKPSEDKWVTDIKKMSVGDIYFENTLAKLALGDPKLPYAKDFEDLPSENWERAEFTIKTNII